MFGHLLKDRSLWEHRYIDLWTIPHALSGVLIAYGCTWLGISPWLGFGASVAIALLWELFEIITHISDVEHHTNGIGDIIVAQVGYGVGIWLLSTYPGSTAAIVAVAATVFAGVSILGWVSHHWYGKK